MSSHFAIYCFHREIDILLSYEKVSSWIHSSGKFPQKLRRNHFILVVTWNSAEMWAVPSSSGMFNIMSALRDVEKAPAIAHHIFVEIFLVFFFLNLRRICVWSTQWRSCPLKFLRTYFSDVRYFVLDSYFWSFFFWN